MRKLRIYAVVSGSVALLALALVLGTVLTTDAPAQSGVGSTVVLLQVTLGSGATQLTSNQTFVRQLVIQNNAAHTMRIGDSTVTSSKGIYLAAGPGGGSFNSGPITAYHTALSDWYVIGTQNDVVDVLYVK